jgi:hypothetical protein
MGQMAADEAQISKNPNTVADGFSNIIMGLQAGRWIKVPSNGTSVSFNVLIGVLAGSQVSGGTHSVAIGPETYNYGKGSNSTAVGRWAGSRFHGNQNTGLGAYAGYHATLNLSGNSNTFIGYHASYSDSNVTNTIAIGTNFNVSGSNKIYLGSSLQATVLGKATANSTATNVLVRNPSGEIETRTIGSLNQVNIRVITSNTTTTSTDHVILTTTASSGLTITLISTPVDGQVVVIKDKSGNANVKNITINGGGKNIDGSSSAVINTNYGAAKLVYSSSENAWFSIGMII